MRSRTKRALARGAVAGLALGVLGIAGGGSPVAAATQAGTASYACSGGANVILPLQYSAPATVPQNGAALVQSSVGFGPLAALAAADASVVRVEMTFALQEAVGDVDLRFGEAAVKARDWDARGGIQVAVTFQSEYPVPVADAQLPGVTEVYTFDPDSMGQTLAWQAFRSVAVTFLEGGVERTVTCDAQDRELSLVSTLITAPTVPHTDVVPASEAQILASDAGTVGLPVNYDPDKAPVTTPGQGNRPSGSGTGAPGRSTTGTGVGGGVSIGGVGPGAPAADGGGGTAAEVATGTTASEPVSRSWTWAIIALGVASAIAVVAIILRGQRRDDLDLGEPPSKA